MINIGIVGLGFVGKAVQHGFKVNNNLFIADPKLGTSVQDLLDKNLDVVFICAPTPMSETGEINDSIVGQILVELEPLENTLIVLKSTVTPNIVEKFANLYKNFVYNPEFLTERNALDDFTNPVHQVFGGSFENTRKLEQIYYKHSICQESRVFHMTAKEASFVKYGMNTFLATKVIFFNQFFDVCEENNVNYNAIVAAITNDSRIGASHTKVPGLDGKRGFSGSCFPKDATAFIAYTQDKTSVLKEAWNSNCDYRNDGEILDREKEQHVTFKKL